MASMLAALGAASALAGGWIGPGVAVATALGLGRDRLERVVLGVAIGRLLLAVATLAASAAGATGALRVWAVLGALAGIWAVARAPRGRAGSARPIGTALAIGAVCAFVLVHAVVFRSALDHGGTLAFFGRDGANDPFVYGAYALALRDLGPPLANPSRAARRRPVRTYTSACWPASRRSAPRRCPISSLASSRCSTALR